MLYPIELRTRIPQSLAGKSAEGDGEIVARFGLGREMRLGRAAGPGGLMRSRRLRVDLGGGVGDITGSANPR